MDGNTVKIPVANWKLSQDIGLGLGFGSVSPLRLAMIENNQIWYKYTTKANKCAALLTNKLMLVTLFVDFIKKLKPVETINEINRKTDSIKKLLVFILHKRGLCSILKTKYQLLNTPTVPWYWTRLTGNDNAETKPIPVSNVCFDEN